MSAAENREDVEAHARDQDPGLLVGVGRSKHRKKGE
jgi:hypothetical protein